MDFLLPGLGFISGQTIGALIVLMSLKMFRTGFNLKDWGQLLIAVLIFFKWCLYFSVHFNICY